jgi:hypothetical protein
MAASALAEPSHIIILRHGEKISDEDRHLSPQGFERAAALAKYFADPQFLNQYGMPAGIFAGSPRAESSLRSVETIRPTAKALGLRLNSRFDKDDGEGLMESILANPDFDGKTVIICWNRSGIKDLLDPLRDVGGTFPKKWPGEVFNRFWILDQQPSGEYSFKDLPQNLLPSDQE